MSRTYFTEPLILFVLYFFRTAGGYCQSPKQGVSYHRTCAHVCTPGGSKQGTAHSLALLAPSCSGQSPTVPEVSTRYAAAQEGLSPWSFDSRLLAPLHLPAPQAGRLGTESLTLELSRAPAALSRASHTPHSTCCRCVPSCIATTLAASPPTPEDSAGCRHGFRLASTASRSCTQRADEAPAFAADRSLSGRSQLRCAHGLQIWACFARSPRIVQLVSALLRRAARSSPVVNGRTERRPIEAVSSRRRWALGPSGWIAAGVPRLPLSGALGVEHRACQRDDDFHKVRVRLRGIKYRSAAYLLNCVT